MTLMQGGKDGVSDGGLVPAKGLLTVDSQLQH